MIVDAIGELICGLGDEPIVSNRLPEPPGLINLTAGKEPLQEECTGYSLGSMATW
jgi:hypothetical protein